ncbi:hypothetical protein BKA65DRAFT_264172 [Rhexocercosporidium sp. MPI-PUGE-AT-0058]|nr:hypothetical protein BKA65DRAFT_264172 [Rhexocercosporidium sp. MPI-PUGE-AT-0058]
MSYSTIIPLQNSCLPYPPFPSSLCLRPSPKSIITLISTLRLTATTSFSKSRSQHKPLHCPLKDHLNHIRIKHPSNRRSSSSWSSIFILRNFHSYRSLKSTLPVQPLQSRPRPRPRRESYVPASPFRRVLNFSQIRFYSKVASGPSLLPALPWMLPFCMGLKLYATGANLVFLMYGARSGQVRAFPHCYFRQLPLPVFVRSRLEKFHRGSTTTSHELAKGGWSVHESTP